MLKKEQLDNEIYLTYNPTGYYAQLQKEMSEERAKSIVGNITSLIQKYYIYKDIAKKPPEIDNLKDYHHKPIDMIESLKSIPTKNRTHLSLFQDIHSILTSVRDGHLGIRLGKIENLLDLSASQYCSPLDLYIGNSSDNKPVVKIRPYVQCLNVAHYKNKLLEYLESHLNIPLKSINGTDPFDFIQYFGKYQLFRNRHAQFTYNLQAVKHSVMMSTPLDLSDIYDIEYEFENGDIINLNYLLVTRQSLTGIDQKEFDEFHRSLYENEPNPLLIPNLFQAKNLFLKKKGLFSKIIQIK